MTVIFVWPRWSPPLQAAVPASYSGGHYAQVGEPYPCLRMGTEWEHPSRPGPSCPVPTRPARSRLTSTDRW
jgi:hypothetical protein